MTRTILFGKQGREELMKGVDQLSDAVKSTLGAKGKNVIIGTDFGLPIITKDGVTVAQSIMLNDELQNMGASLVKEVARKTAEVAGDGTTTASVLAQAILKKGIEEIDNGGNQLFIKQGIDMATEAVVKELNKISRPIKGESQLINIATVSANNDAEIGKLIGEAVQLVGVDGNITIEESRSKNTTVVKVDGLRFKQGYIDQNFKKPNETKIELDSPVILLYDKKISNIEELVPLLEQVRKEDRPILIIAEDVDGSALFSLIENNLRGVLKSCVVKAPGYGDTKQEMMNDIALITGGMFFREDVGIKLKDANLGNLGVAGKVTITKDSTLILGGNADQSLINETIEALQEQIKDPKNPDIPFLKHRLANLSNGVATILVGGSTQLEVKEKVDRVDDALRATISSLEEGYVAGGGSAFLKCLTAVEAIKTTDKNVQIGINIIKEAIKQPFLQILSNGGMDGTDLIQDVRDGAYGYGIDIKTGKADNLIKAGIIDPTKVSRVALENASSIAGTFLTTDCVILNISDFE